jgi:hypothetical protein
LKSGFYSICQLKSFGTSKICSKRNKMSCFYGKIIKICIDNLRQICYLSNKVSRLHQTTKINRQSPTISKKAKMKQDPDRKKQLLKSSFFRPFQLQAQSLHIKMSNLLMLDQAQNTEAMLWIHFLTEIYAITFQTNLNNFYFMIIKNPFNAS